MKTAALAAALLLLGAPTFSAQAQTVPGGMEFLPIPAIPPPYLFAPHPLAGVMLKPFDDPPPSSGADIRPEPGSEPTSIVKTEPKPASTVPAGARGEAVAALPPSDVLPTPELGARELPASPAALPPTHPTSGTVTVIVENVESANGTINVAVCDKALSRAGCPYTHEVKAERGFVETEFDDIPPGTYAVVGYHDENGNNEFDKIFGMPREPYALSNNASEKLIPTFGDAALPIGAGENSVIIRLKRLGG